MAGRPLSQANPVFVTLFSLLFYGVIRVRVAELSGVLLFTWCSLDRVVNGPLDLRDSHGERRGAADDGAICRNISPPLPC